jgi:hypothetical protein
LEASGFALESRRGPSESFGDQVLVFSDGATTVEVIRDRGQWALELRAPGWAQPRHLGAILAAANGKPQPHDGPRELLDQLPAAVSWREVVPGVLAWSDAFPHREVFVEAEQHRWAAAAFGTRPPALDRLSAWVGRLADAIAAPRSLLPTFGRSEDLARPHVESGRDELHYVVVERGEEPSRRSTTDPNILLEWIFRDVTFAMASDRELAHGDPDEDSRRRVRAKQLVLLGTLHPRWAAVFAEP